MNKEELFSECIAQALDDMCDAVEETPILKLKNLDRDKSVLVIIDMVNGFVNEGNLSSKRIRSINNDIAEISECFDLMGIQRIAFTDCHNSESPEFEIYPKHCMIGTKETELTDEIKRTGIIPTIRKNSTNGFIEDEFLHWIIENRQIDTFVIVGCCTDLCVLQFALTVKAHFNRLNRKSHIIVPANLVETYDGPNHDGDLCNMWALNNMITNGVEVVSDYE